MSPMQIEVLLRFWWDPEATRHDWTPGQIEYITHLVKKGILTNSAVKISPNHEALRPYVEALCDVPEPFQITQWVVREPK